MSKITSEQFRLLSADYTAEQVGLAEEIPLLKEKIRSLKDTAFDISRFIAKAKKFVDIPN